jgi:hypothetical protein
MTNKDSELNINLINKYFGFKCNVIKDNITKCLEEYDKKWLFKSKKIKQCNIIEKDYIHCLVNNNLQSVSETMGEFHTKEHLNKKQLERKKESEVLRNDYITNKLTEEEYLSKVKSYTKNNQMKEL